MSYSLKIYYSLSLLHIYHFYSMPMIFCYYHSFTWSEMIISKYIILWIKFIEIKLTSFRYSFLNFNTTSPFLSCSFYLHSSNFLLFLSTYMNEHKHLLLCVFTLTSTMFPYSKIILSKNVMIHQHQLFTLHLILLFHW